MSILIFATGYTSRLLEAECLQQLENSVGKPFFIQDKVWGKGDYILSLPNEARIVKKIISDHQIVPATVSFFLETSSPKYMSISDHVEALEKCEYCQMYDIDTTDDYEHPGDFKIMDKDETGKDKEYHIIIVEIDCESG